MTRTMMIIAGALLAPMAANAQLFKCTGPDGKVVYSDARCEASSKGTLKVTPMGTTPSEKELADAAAKAEAAKASAAGVGMVPGAPAEAPNAGKVVGGRYQMTNSDKDRIRDLEVGNTRMGAYDEQKSAASLEMSAIRSGLDSRMPSDAKSKRDGFNTDLSSTDAKKRKDSLNKLRELYSNY
jgi:hypothetical protein